MSILIHGVLNDNSRICIHREVVRHTSLDMIVVTFAGRNGDVAFGRDPYSGDWTDTAQLNYWWLGRALLKWAWRENGEERKNSQQLRSEPCRRHMLEQLLNLADRCDGMRVDMAMLCVNDVVERTADDPHYVSFCWVAFLWIRNFTLEVLGPQ